MSKWRRWRELSWTDRRLLLQAALLLVYARLKLPFIEFRVDPATGQELRSAEPADPVLARAQVIARLVGIAAAHSPVALTCLHRSLVLWWLLRRQGIPCALRLGANTQSGPFEAHAWVECAGVALNEQGAHLSRYSPFGQAVSPVGRGRPAWLVARQARRPDNAAGHRQGPRTQPGRLGEHPP